MREWVGAGEPTMRRSHNVDVVDGVAALRGQLEAMPQMEEVCRAVEGVPGVVEVRSYLHPPGAPAPNKAASLRAS